MLALAILSLACVAAGAYAFAWSTLTKSSKLLTLLTIRSWKIFKKNRNWHLCLAILIPDILGRTYFGVLPQSRPQKTAWALDSPGINPSNARSLGWCPSCHGSKLYFKLWWGSCERRGLLSLWVCTSVHLLLHLNCNLKRACLGSPVLGN